MPPTGQGVGDVSPDAILPAAGYQAHPLSDHDHESFRTGVGVFMTARL